MCRGIVSALLGPLQELPVLRAKQTDKPTPLVKKRTKININKYRPSLLTVIFVSLHFQLLGGKKAPLVQCLTSAFS